MISVIGAIGFVVTCIAFMGLVTLVQIMKTQRSIVRQLANLNDVLANVMIKHPIPVQITSAPLTSVIDFR